MTKNGDVCSEIDPTTGLFREWLCATPIVMGAGASSAPSGGSTAPASGGCKDNCFCVDCSGCGAGGGPTGGGILSGLFPSKRVTVDGAGNEITIDVPPPKWIGFVETNWKLLLLIASVTTYLYGRNK